MPISKEARTLVWWVRALAILGLLSVFWAIYDRNWISFASGCVFLAIAGAILAVAASAEAESDEEKKGGKI